MLRVASHEEDSGEESFSSLRPILSYVEAYLNATARLEIDSKPAFDECTTNLEPKLTLTEEVQKVVALVNDFLQHDTPVYSLGPYRVTRQARANWCCSLTSNKLKDYFPGEVIHVTAVAYADTGCSAKPRVRGKVREGGWISLAVPGTDCTWVEPLFECKDKDVIVFREQIPNFQLGYYTLVRRTRANVECDLDSEAIQYLNAGDIVNVLEIDDISCPNRVRAKIQGGAWITLHNTQFNLKFVAEKAPLFAEKNVFTYAVTNRATCVRESETLSSPFMTTIPEGTVVFVLKTKEIYCNNMKKVRTFIQLPAADDFKLGWCSEFVLDTSICQSECEYLFNIPKDPMKAQVYIAQHEKEIYESYFSEDFYESSKYDPVDCSKFENSIQRYGDSILKKKQTQKENRKWRHYFTKSHDNSGKNWNKIYKIDAEDERYFRHLFLHEVLASNEYKEKYVKRTSIHHFAEALVNDIRDKNQEKCMPDSMERQRWCKLVLENLRYDREHGIPLETTFRPLVQIPNLIARDFTFSGVRKEKHDRLVTWLKGLVASAKKKPLDYYGISQTIAMVERYKKIFHMACSVCCDDSMSLELHNINLPCRRDCTICSTCVKTWLRISGDSGKQMHQLRCPGIGCNRGICSSYLEHYLKSKFPEAWILYQTILWKGEMRKCKDFRFCPKNGCGCGFKLPVHCCDLKKVTCPECDYDFCPNCYGPDHSAIGNCIEYLALTTGWGRAQVTKENTKQCPFCFVWIEKNEGCKHMTCHHCHGEFCWLCMGDWKKHGHQPCPDKQITLVKRKKFNQIVPYYKLENKPRPLGIYKILRWAIIRLKARRTSPQTNMLEPNTLVEVLKFQGNRCMIEYNGSAKGWCSCNTENGGLLEFCNDQETAKLDLEDQPIQDEYDVTSDRDYSWQDDQAWYIDMDLKEFNRLKMASRRSNRLEELKTFHQRKKASRRGHCAHLPSKYVSLQTTKKKTVKTQSERKRKVNYFRLHRTKAKQKLEIWRLKSTA